MEKLKSELSISGTTKEVKPAGLTSLVVNIEKEGDFAFYRQKIGGSLSFVGSDFPFIKTAEKDCCVKLPLSVLQPCGSDFSLAFRGIVNTKKIDWSFETCEAIVSELDTEDFYTGVFLHWEKKINMCAMPTNSTVRHWHRVTAPYESPTGPIDSYTYPTVVNTKGRIFADWILYNIRETFKGTVYASIVPATKAELSYFLTAAKNPCTARTNPFLLATIFQNSDLFFPDYEPATGIEIDERVNTNIAKSLKDILEGLKAAFDLDWFIDSDTGKFRIEHKSFFENGLSYSSPNITIDLGTSKYVPDLGKYKYSYKNRQDDIPGVQELIISQNEAANSSDKAVVIAEYTPEVGQDGFVYSFPKLDDFSLGNIKYESPCISKNEKGETVIDTRNCELFGTHAHAVFMKDESIDLNGWTLLDITDIFLGQKRVKGDVCERAAFSGVLNAGFSATALMRDFHRWGRPFNYGLMAYDETPGDLLGQGFFRPMYSVIYSKEYKEIDIVFCCGDSFDARKLVKLPNGELIQVKSLSIDYANKRLRFQPVGVAACGFSVSFPDNQTGGECPAKDTVLSVQVIKTVCYGGCTGIYNEIEGVRTVYADGFCGSYIKDVFPDCPPEQTEC